MTPQAAPLPAVDIDPYVARFEAALASDEAATPDGVVNLVRFLPDPSALEYLPVLVELVRVDLEFGWGGAAPRGIDHYLSHFPILASSKQALADIAFEEYRLRRHAGQSPQPAEYERRYGIDARHWPQGHSSVQRPFNDAPADAAETGAPPRVGGRFAGFELLAELGRGAFGTVFLARQGDLADRPVALKISRDVRLESHTLARLQHASIVPIHSIHRVGPWQAVCMPYFGPTTLADVLRALPAQGIRPPTGTPIVDTIRARQHSTRRLSSHRFGEPASGSDKVSEERISLDRAAQPSILRLQGLSFVQAALWIALRLAEGLAHAHERGILHRDLKPANVLLADDGQPMLLDFNLSTDIGPTAAPAALAGGTLPYMSPEVIQIMRSGEAAIDARSDLYSLGVILYELLAGCLPFPTRTGRLDDVLDQMASDRVTAPAALSQANATVSPSIEAIVRKCLAHRPADRYQSTLDLCDDLDRELHDLPLRHAPQSLGERGRKWLRRHPRFLSTTTAVAAAALLLMAAAGLSAYRGQQLAKHEAMQTFAAFQRDFQTARIQFLDVPTAGIAEAKHAAEACRKALDHYDIDDDGDWATRKIVARLPDDAQQTLRRDAQELTLLLAAAEQLQSTEKPWATHPAEHASVEKQDDDSPRSVCFQATWLMRQRRPREALPLWRRGVQLDPRNVWAWYGLGHCCEQLHEWSQAAECYSACIALQPEGAEWHGRRGYARLEQQQFDGAVADLTRCLELAPDDGRARRNRALALLKLDRPDEARRDLEHLIHDGNASQRIYLALGESCEMAGDPEAAELARQQASQVAPATAEDWVARGVADLPTSPAAALTDFDAALARNPRSLEALESKAHVLAEKLDRAAEAIVCLDRAVALYPENGSVRAARGVLLARQNWADEALRDAKSALSLDDSAVTLFQVGCIHALHSSTHPSHAAEAVAQLRAGFGGDLLTTDPDLRPLHDFAPFQELVEAARTLYPLPALPHDAGRASSGAQLSQ